MDNQVTETVKKERLKRLMDLQAEIGYSKNLKYVGREVDVLFDAQGKNGIITGRTATNKLVKVTAGEDILGTIRNVAITGAEPWSLRGDMV